MHICNQDVLQQLPENGDVSELTLLQLEESATEEQEQLLQEHLNGAHLCLAYLCLLLYSSILNRRQFASPSNNDRVDQPTPSCGPLLLEHQVHHKGYFSMAFDLHTASNQTAGLVLQPVLHVLIYNTVLVQARPTMLAFPVKFLCTTLRQSD